ncbi:hypothetical protein RUM43_004581 [Polyplax serrata]|uniref:Acyl-CoA-binding domain-containing protein 6 n=1 Tax=Polyplax serrata TaxID=468196 RepID=A0AAN8SB12_POLSC
MTQAGELKILFDSATSHVKGIVQNLTKQQALEFYGFYKQATEGPCNRGKPHWYEMTEKQKWEAWSTLNNMDTETAMECYVRLLGEIDPEWRSKPTDGTSACWVHHSCMKSEDETIQDSEKTIFDWVKEKNLEMVKRHSANVVSVNELDEAGMSLLHWAADRGSLDVVKYLVDTLGADVNVRDTNGQTPLHFAVSCDYEDVEKYLVKAGADINLRDNEGFSPYEISS